MSSGRMPQHYSELHPMCDTRQAAQQQSQPQSYPHVQTPQPFSYPYPYTGQPSGYPAFATPARQPASDPAYRQNFGMPDFSSLTNSALVDALLTPSANEYEQQLRSAHPPETPLPSQDNRGKRARPSEEITGELSELGDHDHRGPARKQTRSSRGKGSKKQSKRKSTLPSESEEEYVEDVQYDEQTSPEPVRKSRRTTRVRKASPPVDFPTPDDDEYSPPKKPNARKAAASSRKSKQPQARAGRLVRKKPIGMAVPKTLSEAGPPDRMMWEWKNQGRNWEEIRSEWKRMTGIEPGGSSLSVRYIKLVENLARNGAAGDIELLRFKKEAEDELLSQLWTKVAEKMYSYSPESEHNPKDLQKRYNMIVRSGYDVEQLVKDDAAKREQDLKPQIMKGNDYQDDFDMDIGEVNAYDDDMANQTAASISEHNAIAFGGDIALHSRLTDAQSSVTHGHGNTFQRAKTRPQVIDGVDEQKQQHDIKTQIQGRCNSTLPAISTTDMSADSFSDLKQIRFEPSQQRASMANTLVVYDSDSE